jgi:hypothetical protein
MWTSQIMCEHNASVLKRGQRKALPAMETSINYYKAWAFTGNRGSRVNFLLAKNSRGVFVVSDVSWKDGRSR